MNDANSTAKRKSFLLIAGAGSVILFCVGLLAGGWFVGASFIASSSTVASAQGATTSEDAAIAEAVEPQQNGSMSTEKDENTSDTDEAGVAPVSAPAAQSVTAGDPTIGSITFAPETTAGGEAIEPDFLFEAGITQIHALFDYEGFSSEHIWTQVWYHDGIEVFSSSQPWLEGESGTYDYLIEAGGEPLPAGEWALEFYIDDQLMTAGSFSIEAEVEPQETVDLPDLADIPRIYKLAYTKWNGEKHDLYLGDSLGSREQWLLGRSAGPSWSPDGRYLFLYGEEGIDNQMINGRLYPLPGTTNGVARLKVAPVPANIGQVELFQGHGWNDGTARSANVSPDGSMIAYDGDRGGGRRIYFLGTEANQQFRIEIIGEQADWSPDSQRIVYRSGRNNQTGLWISNRTDSGHIRLTGGGTDSFPSWSPDGKTIAFSREAGGNVDIYRVDVDGSNLVRLTDAIGHDTLPAYLPNGDLVFRSARGGSWGIWKMEGDGTEQVQIIGHAPVGPDWSFSRIGVLR